MVKLESAPCPTPSARVSLAATLLIAPGDRLDALPRDRSSVDDGPGRDGVDEEPDGRPAPAGDVCVRLRRADALALHPDRDVSAQGTADPRHEPDRSATLAHDLLKAGLSQRGYLTATSIMDLETVLKALEAAQRAAGAAAAGGTVARARSGEILLLGLRHAVGEGDLGLARRRASRLAALHRRQRHAGRVVADILRQQSRPRCARARRRACGFSAPRRTRRGRCCSRSTPSQRAKAIINATAPGDMVTMANVDISPLSPSGLDGGGDDRARSAIC